jgi:hypothetical protein
VPTAPPKQVAQALAGAVTRFANPDMVETPGALAMDRKAPAADGARDLLERVQDYFVTVANAENAHALGGWTTQQTNGSG